ncbi:TetR/AcrR family transcriptional regulator [Alteribacillus bidgolensis]|uniref:Transcriptional regulator, TetR family n=1 Tax=Alteribacillus bidgolensis TaxID=930129 RepID=A0A1G8RU15_9BACI|nr:TetR/AcrR family transcriptional regulator [Alteribacillus bidgolensis]SDJ20458.1 transcriptional regulator, TetR family [Alteribacillus bidgolensis]
MRKGEQTRRHIVQKSAELFNQKGYAGCSMNDIMEATGLQKGGIYRNFKSKDEIALEAFDYAIDTVNQHFSEAMLHANTALEKIGSFFDVYEDVINNPPVKGGCPLLNTAVDSDDTNPLLRKKALVVFHTFLNIIEEIIEEGIQNRELNPDIDTKAVASFIVAILEGSIMTSKLERDNKHVSYSKQQVLRYLLML